MSVRVVPLTEDGVPAWEAFVASHPDATFFHRAGWATVIERAFGQRPLYAMAEQDGAVVGVLPLVHMCSALFGSAVFASTPR